MAAEDHLISVETLKEIHRLGHKAYKEGRLGVPGDVPNETVAQLEAAVLGARPGIEPDPHGIVEVFARRMNQNLDLMHPDAAAREAMAAVDAFLKSSTFIDLGHKGSTERAHLRVDKKPEEVRR